MPKKYFFSRAKRTRQISMILVVLAVAVTGTALLISGHAATPYASINADTGSLSNGAAKQTCTGAADGSCVVFGGSGGTTPNFFPVGVYVQPTSNFGLWKGRGVNTVIDVPQGNDAVAWNAAAEQQGLYMIRAASSDPASDKNNPWLLAWSLGDEPEGNGVSASTLISQYQQLKSVDANIPVQVNFVGGSILGLQGSCNQSCYLAYGPAFDWGSNDIYPVTGWGAPNNLTWVGQAVSKMLQWFPNRPEFAYIETSNQLLPWIPNDTGPTAGQVRAEIWDALIHGAHGIEYFPLACPNGGSCSFSFDATPSSVVTEITAQDALMQNLAAPLLAPLNPNNLSVSVSSSLEASWRVVGNTKYAIVLNTSNSTVNNASIGLTGFSDTQAPVYNESRTVSITNNTITDSFTPYQVHIYQL